MVLLESTARKLGYMKGRREAGVEKCLRKSFSRKINLNLGQKDSIGKSKKNSMCKDPGVVGCTVHFSKGAEKMPT